MVGQDEKAISEKAGKSVTNDGGSSAVDPSWRPIVRWGGLCMFLAGVILIVFIVGQGVLGMELPLDPEDTLEDPVVPTALFIVTIVGEFLLFPGFLALFFALRGHDKAKMFMATVFAGFSVVMFLCSRSHILSLSLVSDGYTDAATETLREAYVAAADSSLWIQHVYSTMALMFLSVASAIVGVVMLRSGVFGRALGYVAILSGVFTVFTPFQVLAGIPIAVAFVGLVLMLIWQFTVGIKLFRLGGQGATADVAAKVAP